MITIPKDDYIALLESNFESQKKIKELEKTLIEKEEEYTLLEKKLASLKFERSADEGVILGGFNDHE